MGVEIEARYVFIQQGGTHCRIEPLRVEFVPQGGFGGHPPVIQEALSGLRLPSFLPGGVDDRHFRYTSGEPHTVGVGDRQVHLSGMSTGLLAILQLRFAVAAADDSSFATALRGVYATGEVASARDVLSAAGIAEKVVAVLEDPARPEVALLLVPTQADWSWLADQQVRDEGWQVRDEGWRESDADIAPGWQLPSSTRCLIPNRPSSTAQALFVAPVSTVSEAEAVVLGEDGARRLRRSLLRAAGRLNPQLRVTQDVMEKHGAHFKGRQREIDALDDFLRSRTSGLLVVTGEAGAGKTALLSSWARRLETRPDFHVAMHFFGIEAKMRDTEKGWRSLCQQLGKGEVDIPLEDAAKVLRLALAESRPDGPVVVLLDALDEASAIPLPPFTTPLPGGVFVVVSTRAGMEGTPPVDRWLAAADRLVVGRLDEQTIMSVLAARGLPADPESARRVDRATDGLALYAHHLLEDLERGGGWKGLSTEPIGIDAYLAMVLDKLPKDDAHRALLGVLSVARGPLDASDLNQLTGLDEIQLRALPSELRRWLRVDSGPPLAIGFTHPRLRADFSRHLGGAANQRRAQLLEHCRRWRDHRSRYALRYLPGHLSQAGEDPGLAFRDFGYLMTRLDVLGDGAVLGVLEDLHALPDPVREPLSDLREFLSARAHRLERFGATMLLQLAMESHEHAWVRRAAEEWLKGDGAQRTWLRRVGEPLPTESMPCRTLHSAPHRKATVAYTQDGRRVIHAIHDSRDASITAWEVGTWKKIRSLPGDRGPALVHPDGRLVVSCGDQTVRIWNLDAGELESELLLTGSDRVESIALDDPGEMLLILTRGKPRRLLCWDLRESQPSVVREGFEHAALAPTGRVAIVAEGTSVTVLDCARGLSLRSFSSDRQVWQLAVDDSGERAVVLDEVGALSLWDTASGKRLATLAHEGEYAAGCALTVLRGSRLVAALHPFRERGLQLWRLTSGELLESFGLGWDTDVVAADGTNRWLVVGCGDSVYLWAADSRKDTSLGEKIGAMIPAPEVTAAAFSPASDGLVLSSGDGYLQVWDVEAARRFKGTLSEGERRTPSRHLSREFGDEIAAVSFHPDGWPAISLGMRWKIWWNPRTGEPLERVERKLGSSNWVCTAADGTRSQRRASAPLVLVGDDGELTTAEEQLADDPRPLGRLRASTQEIRRIERVAVHEPLARAATSSHEDDRLCLWDLSSGQATRWLTGHHRVRAGDGPVEQLTFSPDGHRLASAGRDGLLLVWDVETGQLVGQWHAAAPLCACAVSSTGQLMFGDEEGRVGFLDWMEGSAPARAEVALPGGVPWPLCSVAVCAPTAELLRRLDASVATHFRALGCREVVLDQGTGAGTIDWWLWGRFDVIVVAADTSAWAGLSAMIIRKRALEAATIEASRQGTAGVRGLVLPPALLVLVAPSVHPQEPSARAELVPLDQPGEPEGVPLVTLTLREWWDAELGTHVAQFYAERFGAFFSRSSIETAYKAAERRGRAAVRLDEVLPGGSR
ncbi:MAG: AAA family ATPase [Deltaproteobacteria bacterium]|nr:AAA family ATPase [Deltaproteobacteria bacterium]